MGKRGPKSAGELATFRPVVPATGKKPAPDRVPPPDHLQPSTRAWWIAIVEQYQFHPHDLPTLQAAAESWDRYQQARLALAEHGLTFTDDKGATKQRPEVCIERDSGPATFGQCASCNWSRHSRHSCASRGSRVDSMNPEQRKAELFALIERYCQLGRLLPAVDSIDTNDEAAIAEIRVVLAEMIKTKAEIDPLLVKDPESLAR